VVFITYLAAEGSNHAKFKFSASCKRNISNCFSFHELTRIKAISHNRSVVMYAIIIIDETKKNKLLTPNVSSSAIDTDLITVL
jgi:hypothetical protein